jgi:putative tRNA adenosine deaminase-associated protein
VSHFAALLARSHDRWRGVDSDSDVARDIADAADIEDVADMMRDASIDDGPVLLFVEEDDEWFGIVRVDGTAEPMAFISDARVVPVSELAASLFADLVPEPEFAGGAAAAAPDDAVSEDDDERSGSVLATEPTGAADLLADFGITGPELLAMCAEEGALPADVITAICERLGCVDEIEVYR